MPDLDPEDRHFELTELLLRELHSYMGSQGRHWNTDSLVQMQRIIGELSSGHIDYRPVYSTSSRQGLEDIGRRQILSNRARRIILDYQQHARVERLLELQRLIFDLVGTHEGISPAWLRASADLTNLHEGRLLLSQVDG